MPRCPSCDSDNAVKAQVIYNNGTSIGSSVSDVGGGGKVVTDSLAQTNEAARCAPPAKIPYEMPVFGIMALGAIIFAIAASQAGAEAGIG